MCFIVEDNHPVRRFPLIVTLLIFANVGLYLPFALSGDLYLPDIVLPTLDQMIQEFGFRPSRGSFASLFLSLFLHVNLWHLLGNMYVLYLFGDNVEDVLGSILFLICYLMCGFAGLLLHSLVYSGSDVPVVGASGAISGILGIYIILFPHVKLKFVRVFSFERYEPFKISAYALILIWLLLSTFISVYPLLARIPVESNVAHFGHIGGLLAGIGLSLIFVQLGMLRGFEEYSERGKDDMEPLAPAAGGPLIDAENAAGAFGSELIFSLWYLLFYKSYRDRRIRFWRQQCQSAAGVILVLLEIVLIVAVGVGLIAGFVLIVLDPAIRRAVFEFVNSELG